jgi:hypothetical protein
LQFFALLSVLGSVAHFLLSIPLWQTVFRYSGINMTVGGSLMRRGFLSMKACALALMTAATFATTAFAADSKLDSVLQRGHLIVGTGSTNAPWHFQGADGKLQGLYRHRAHGRQRSVQRPE